MTYQPFYLTLSGTPETATVAMTDAAGGLATTALDAARWAALAPSLAAVRGGATDRGSVAVLGRGLFDWLFVPALRDLYEGRRGGLGPGARLRLLLRADSPALAGLPWEMLCHTGTNEFLALDPALSPARYLPRPLRPPPALRTGPLRILAVFAGPRDQPALDLGRELALIQRALQGIDSTLVTVDVLMAEDEAASGLTVTPQGPPTLAALTAALADGYDVLHYAGHGALTPGGGVLVLEDEDRRTALLDADALAVAVRGSRLRVAVLSACETAATLNTPSNAPTIPLAVAPVLIGAGLDAALAMGSVVPDGSAILLGQTLYRELARNTPLDAAVSQARKALYMQSGQADWAIPILYLQDIGDGQLWLPPTATDPVTAPPPVAPLDIQVNSLNSYGGPVAIGGNVTDNRQTTVRHGGIEFHGATTIHGPTVGGDVDNLTYNAGPAPLPLPVPSPDVATAIRPAFAALIEALDDDAALGAARELRRALLAPQPQWQGIAAARAKLAAMPSLTTAVSAFFADPAVRPIVQAAKLRALEN
ncbi:MAG: CHAT domain-containing protein [Chloroflexota bacterium]|nr:CHAT domain-containing protein [Chloroflexota bacterium]